MTPALADLDTEYKDTVEKYAKKNLELEIPNSTLGHAALVSKSIIDNTKRNLIILTGDANEIDCLGLRENLDALANRIRNPHFFYQFLNTLRRKDKHQDIVGRIRILFSDESPNNNDFYNFARDYADIMKIKKFKNPNTLTPHFLVSDSIRYRLEEDHTKDDLKDYEINAEANFNKPVTAEVFEEFFNKCWNLEDKLIPIQ